MIGSKAEDYRRHLGSFGVSGDLALRPVYTLSGGQKSRTAFALMTWRTYVAHSYFIDLKIKLKLITKYTLVVNWVVDIRKGCFLFQKGLM